MCLSLLLPPTAVLLCLRLQHALSVIYRTWFHLNLLQMSDTNIEFFLLTPDFALHIILVSLLCCERKLSNALPLMTWRVFCSDALDVGAIFAKIFVRDPSHDPTILVPAVFSGFLVKQVVVAILIRVSEGRIADAKEAKADEHAVERTHVRFLMGFYKLTAIVQEMLLTLWLFPMQNSNDLLDNIMKVYYIASMCLHFFAVVIILQRWAHSPGTAAGTLTTPLQSTAELLPENEPWAGSLFYCGCCRGRKRDAIGLSLAEDKPYRPCYFCKSNDLTERQLSFFMAFIPLLLSVASVAVRKFDDTSTDYCHMVSWTLAWHIVAIAMSTICLVTLGRKACCDYYGLFDESCAVHFTMVTFELLAATGIALLSVVGSSCGTWALGLFIAAVAVFGIAPCRVLWYELNDYVERRAGREETEADYIQHRKWSRDRSQRHAPFSYDEFGFRSQL